MSPRKRSPINASLPPGLRVRDGLYSWTHPIDKREKGLGRDRAAAIRWARSANIAVDKLRGEVSAEEWVRGTTARSWGAWLDRYQHLLDERESTKATRYHRKSLMKRARAQWPKEINVSAVDVAMVADAIRELTGAGKQRMAQSYRSFLHDCFRCAIAQGWRTDNPVSVTDKVKVKTQRARLTLENFRAIYADPETKEWLRNAMALALVSGQRREDIARAMRKDIRDGAWWCQQRKTGNRVVIPLGIRLDALGMSLADVLEQCKSTGILSHYIIHQTFARDRGKPVAIRAFTNYFTAAVARLGIDWGDKSPPTFHELRSLSKRLYDNQGGVDTKQLLGHKSASAAALYGDSRGEWVKVSITR